MTFNIAHAALAGGDLARVAAVIRSAHPDVVGLQEVDLSWSRSGGVDQAGELGRLLGMRPYFAPNVDCTARDLQGDGFCRYGTAILSRYPIVAGSGRRFALPGMAGEEPRGIARVLVDVAGRRLEVFNTHLSSFEPLRVRQAAFVKRLVRPLRRPFLVLGDFNALPFYLEMVSLRRVTRDAAIAAGRPDLRTTSLAHPVRLDYILLPRPPLTGPPERVAALSARVIYTPRVSDHRPLVARVRIP
jgi:endonuclease/exonuclease/phosphatase family metal-dependent hydrolase